MHVFGLLEEAGALGDNPSKYKIIHGNSPQKEPQLADGFHYIIFTCILSEKKNSALIYWQKLVQWMYGAKGFFLKIV